MGIITSILPDQRILYVETRQGNLNITTFILAGNCSQNALLQQTPVLFREMYAAVYPMFPWEKDPCYCHVVGYVNIMLRYVTLRLYVTLRYVSSARVPLRVLGAGRELT